MAGSIRMVNGSRNHEATVLTSKLPSSGRLFTPRCVFDKGSYQILSADAQGLPPHLSVRLDNRGKDGSAPRVAALGPGQTVLMETEIDLGFHRLGPFGGE